MVLVNSNYSTSSHASLTGSFKNSGNQANGDHWKAKISYKVEAEVDSPDSGEVLKVI